MGSPGPNTSMRQLGTPVRQQQQQQQPGNDLRRRHTAITTTATAPRPLLQQQQQQLAKPNISMMGDAANASVLASGEGDLNSSMNQRPSQPSGPMQRSELINRETGKD